MSIDIRAHFTFYSECLHKYTTEKINFVKHLFFNNHSRDWFADLGQYIIETLEIEKIPQLEFLTSQSQSSRYMASLAIHFISSVLDEEALQKMFGPPLLHEEFGEGFTGKYNPETDDYEEPEIKASYASYFVKIQNSLVHIGYDHRGTNIEFEGSFPSDGRASDEVVNQQLEILKELVQLYQQAHG